MFSCLVDGQSDDSNSAFISPRPTLNTLQFTVDVFRFAENPQDLVRNYSCWSCSVAVAGVQLFVWQSNLKHSCLNPVLFNLEVDTQSDHKASVEGLLQLMGMKMFEELQHPSKASGMPFLGTNPARVFGNCESCSGIVPGFIGTFYQIFGCCEQCWEGGHI